jgi:CRISPR-associated protein Cmx8
MSAGLQSERKPRGTRTTRARRPSEGQVLTLNYYLGELPSSQHRAGLAGMVLVIRWLERQRRQRGICELPRVDATGATVRLDVEGLCSLFDDIYAAALEEQERSQPLKNQRTKKIVQPLREETREVVDQATGRTKSKTVYIYPQVVPRGSFLADFDRPADGGSGLWIKLWRDMLWEVIRGKPLARGPYDARASKEATNDAEREWSNLTGGGSAALSSTYFIGAQDATAESVPFTDQARYRFLLHFSSFAMSIYRPCLFDREGSRDLVGYALAIPDIADLAAFCEELPEVLRGRGNERSGYLPREALVDLAVESALDLLRRMAARMAAIENRRSVSDLVLGIDVVHIKRDGNNVRILGSTRLEPDLRMLDHYDRIRGVYWDPSFRRQSLANILAARPWFEGFDALVRSLPLQRTIESKSFRHDAREAFTRTEVNVSDKAEGGAAAPTAEAQIYRMVGNYIARKVESKHQLRWEQVKDQPALKGKYEEAREKVAKDAFLAVRSRTGNDFVDYFTGTLCSVPQHVGEDGYRSITKALLAEPDRIRALTLLALSARG